MLYQQNKHYPFEHQFLDNPFDLPDRSDYKEKLQDVTAEWLLNATSWISFITLTFRDEVSPEKAIRELQLLIRTRNQLEYGNNYTRKVGHSFFSYVAGMELQSRGVFHFHMLVDRALNYELIHHYWNTRNGFAWIESLNDYETTRMKILYTLKYALKNGGAWIFLK